VAAADGPKRPMGRPLTLIAESDLNDAYWDTPTGDFQRRRAAIGTSKGEPAARQEADADGFEDPIGNRCDSLTGPPNEATRPGGCGSTRARDARK
jgi:hypothetical protein